MLGNLKVFPDFHEFLHSFQIDLLHLKIPPSLRIISFKTILLRKTIPLHQEPLKDWLRSRGRDMMYRIDAQLTPNALSPSAPAKGLSLQREHVIQHVWIWLHILVVGGLCRQFLLCSIINTTYYLLTFLFLVLSFLSNE